MKLKKIISSSLIAGLLFNSAPVSFAGVLSDDGRYESFEGSNITVDNILEEDNVDVELEGNTLVNILNDDYYVSSYSNYTNGVYTLEQKSSDTNLALNKKNIPYKQDTVYTLIVNIEENTLADNGSGNVATITSDGLGEGAYALNTGHINIKYNETGIKKIKATTRDVNGPVFTHMLVHKNTNIPNGNIKFSWILLEGDWTNKEIPNYFEGIKSVGQNDKNGNNIEVVSNNKNLFNPEEVYEAGYSMGVPYTKPIKVNEENGTFIQMTEKNYWNVGIGFHIKTEKNSDYTLTVNSFSNDGVNMELRAIGVYAPEFPFKDKPNIDSYLDRLLAKELNEDNNTLTYNSKDYDYILFYIGGGWNPNANEVKTLSISQIEVQKSSLKSESYTLPLSNTLQIPLKEPLRGLPNGVKDRIIKRNNQWVMERNLAQYTITGNENWLNDSTTENNLYNTYRMMLHFPTLKSGRANIISDKFSFKTDYTVTKDSSEGIFGSFNGSTLYIDISKEKIDNISGSNINEKFKTWLSQNPVTIVYELLDIYTEPINADLSFDLYEDTTHISNSSTIPANMKVVVDRTMNRAIEAIELAKINPIIDNISRARYWTNLLKESIEKDKLQSEINSIANILDLQLEKKTTTANMDVYIKLENILSLSLSSNSITFEDFNGTEDLEQNRAIELSINSSLPYEINAYLEEEIQNADKTAIMDKQILNLKESSTTDYKEFTDVKTKLTLISNSDAGNNKIHSFDFKLNGGIAHKKDVYKTTIKFEAIQK